MNSSNLDLMLCAFIIKHAILHLDLDLTLGKPLSTALEFLELSLLFTLRVFWLDFIVALLVNDPHRALEPEVSLRAVSL